VVPLQTAAKLRNTAVLTPLMTKRGLAELQREAVQFTRCTSARALHQDTSKRALSSCWSKRHEWVGQRAVRVFYGERVGGVISACWVNEGAELPSMWHMEHDDGDAEDLSQAEAWAAMQSHVTWQGAARVRVLLRTAQQVGAATMAAACQGTTSASAIKRSMDTSGGLHWRV
jgi:hypothetical protein